MCITGGRFYPTVVMAKSAQPPPGSGIQYIGEAILVIVGAFFAASISVSVLTSILVGVTGLSASSNTVLVIRTVVQFVTIIAVVVGYVRLVDTDQLIRAVVPGPRGVGLILGGTTGLVIAQNGLNRLFKWADISTGANQAVIAGSGDPNYFLAMVVVSLLFVGPAEELLVRGAVQGRLREAWGAWPSIIAATTLFGLIHIPAVTGGLEGQLSYAVTAGLLGVVLGYLYEYTNNIVVPMVTHGCYNGFVFVLLYLGEIGVIG